MYEELLAAVAAQLVDLPPAEWDERMGPMLETLSDSLGAERSRCELGPEAARVFPCGGSWQSDSFEGDRSFSQPDWIHRSLTDLPWLADQLANARVLSIPAVAELPREAAGTAEFLRKLGVESAIFVPLVAHGSLVGVLGIEGVHCEPARVKALRVVGDMFVSALERVIAEENLRISGTRVAGTRRLETLGELAGGVAHDLNSILTAIIGNCELLAEDIEAPSDAASEELVEIRSAAEFASELVERILSFGHGGKKEPRSVDLNWMIVRSTALLSKLIGRGIEVIPDLQEGLGTVRADPAQLEQLIVNLAINARDAMPSGGELRIRARNLEIGDSGGAYAECNLSPGSYLELSVEDKGCGMDAETRAHALDPFFTTKTLGRGTGLGLPTVANIVDEAGGVLAIESELGCGTTIRAFFPREQDSANRLALAGVRPGKTETALVVDANPLVRQLLCWALESEGLRVLEAHDEASAAEDFDGFGPRIDLLVADLGLPRRIGCGLSAALTELEPGLRTLYVSDHPECAIREEGLLADNAVVVELPFVQLDLARALQRSRAASKKRAIGELSWDVIPSPPHGTTASARLHGSKRVDSERVSCAATAGTKAGIRSEPNPSSRSPQPTPPLGSG